MNDEYLRPGRTLGAFSRLYPNAWKQVDEFRADRKGLGNWPDWCFLPLAGAFAIVSKGPRSRRSTGPGTSASWVPWPPGG
jgi:hypothetical protein